MPQTMRRIGGVEASRVVRHGKATIYPGATIYGVERASDGLWSWMFVDDVTGTLRNEPIWSAR